jgi:hypothetical protein
MDLILLHPAVLHNITVSGSLDSKIIELRRMMWVYFTSKER